MNIKGEMTLELQDIHSGRKELIHKSNMVTDLVKDFFAYDPMKAWSMDTAGKKHIYVTNEYLPVCPKLIGGVLLFSKKLKEDPSVIYPPGDNLPVAYASNNVNATDNLRRGNANSTETIKTDKGYQFVWNFLPEQGNGTIASLGLTSISGGRNGFGSPVNVITQLTEIRSRPHSYSEEIVKKLHHTVEIDFEKNISYSIYYESGKVYVCRYRYPVFNIGLNETLDNLTVTLLEKHEITGSVFHPKTDSYGSSYYTFGDGEDGYWYGFANTAGGYAAWIKISKADYSYKEGSFDYGGTGIAAFRTEKLLDKPYSESWSAFRKGYLYVYTTNLKSLYKIKMSDPSDYKKIELGFTSAAVKMGNGCSCPRLIRIGDLIEGWEFQLDLNDNVIKTAAEQKGTAMSMSTPLFKYRHFLFGYTSESGQGALNIYLLNPFLATICNLDDPVEKTPDKTMKVIYTLSQA